MGYYVYSTLANSQGYAAHDRGPDGMPSPVSPVIVKGGSGIANKNLITPRGVATEISDEEHARLLADPVFQLHQKNGYVTIEGRRTEPERVASNLSHADPSRPLEPADIELDEQPAKLDEKSGGKRRNRSD